MIIPLSLALWAAAPAADESADALAFPRTMQGYLVAVAGYGMANANRADAEWLPTWPGWGTSVRLGQQLDDTLGLALCLQLGRTTGSKRRALIGGAGIEGQVTVLERLMLRGGVGLGFAGVSLRASDDDDEDEINGRFGERYTLGASWALFPFHEGGSGGLAISPVIQVAMGPDASFTSVALWAGVEVGWWLGLPPNKLAAGP